MVPVPRAGSSTAHLKYADSGLGGTTGELEACWGWQQTSSKNPFPPLLPRMFMTPAWIVFSYTTIGPSGLTDGEKRSRSGPFPAKSCHRGRCVAAVGPVLVLSSGIWLVFVLESPCQ